MRLKTAHAWYREQVAKGWQRWFAWSPVEIDPDNYAWLETVERKITGMNDSSDERTATYEYRFLPTKEKE